MAKLRQRPVAFLCTILGLAGLFAATANAAPAGPPRVSPSATVTQTVGVADVTIAYSRPAVRERTVFGELVPFGELWRTGANEATTFRISHDASIGGKALPAGTYALFTIPGETEWTVLWNSEAEQWGGFNRDADKDVLSISVPVTKASHQENFEIAFAAVSAAQTTVTLRWAETSVAFDVAFDMDAIEIATAEAEVASGENRRAPFLWARHWQQQGKNLGKALEWATMSANFAPSYWTHSLHARVLQATGKVDEARAAAEKAFGLVESDRNAAAAGRNAETLREEMKAW